MNACRFKHTGLALALLERSIALDPDLGRHIDRWQGRQAFVDFLIQHPGSLGAVGRPRARVDAVGGVRDSSGDERARRQRSARVPSLVRGRTLGAPTLVRAGADWIDRAGRLWEGPRAFIVALLEGDPALLRITPTPRSSAIVWALDYGNAHLLPLLTRIWPLPDDLPHAAGTGDAAAVKRWFDATGRPVLGSLMQHYPRAIRVSSVPTWVGDLRPRSKLWTSRSRGRF